MQKVNEELINKVASIASERDNLESMIYPEDGKKFHPFLDGEVNPKWNALNEKLENVMLELNDEDLIMLETIMLIGRDGDEGTGKKGQELYNSVESYTRTLYQDKSGAVDYMTAKADFGTYLNDGLKYLK